MLELTKSEMEIMNVLWDAPGPMSRADLLAHSEEKSWKDSSVHILLNGILHKGLIREVGYVKRSKTYGRTFAPTMTREEYYAQVIYSQPYKPDIVRLVRALLCKTKPTEEEREQLRQMLQ